MVAAVDVMVTVAAIVMATAIARMAIATARNKCIYTINDQIVHLLYLLIVNR